MVKQKGFILVVVLTIVLVLLVAGSYISYMFTINFKTATAMKQDFIFFSEADGGVFATAGWMAYYKRTDVPQEVSETSFYRVISRVLAHRVRYPAGYSLAWKGMDVRLDSISKNGNSGVESVVFIPVAPAGYGNE